ncbi:MAG: hypothetical protein OSJ58_02790 [Dysosmobacter sp.]|nr:hypothetical protein [Dysosmobacter sp.]
MKNAETASRKIFFSAGASLISPESVRVPAEDRFAQQKNFSLPDILSCCRLPIGEKRLVFKSCFSRKSRLENRRNVTAGQERDTMTGFQNKESSESLEKVRRSW